MATVKEHYDSLLSEVYTWLYGGFDENKNRNAEFFKSRNILPQKAGQAVDLGAGSGFQSIPLAESGFSVTAIDLSRNLLNELEKNARGLQIRTVQDDLLHFQDHCQQGIDEKFLSETQTVRGVGRRTIIRHWIQH